MHRCRFVVTNLAAQAREAIELTREARYGVDISAPTHFTQTASAQATTTLYGKKTSQFI